MPRRDSFRFAPPRFEVPPELRWVLVRSFGPVGAAVPPVERRHAVRDMARRLGMAGRIGGRHEAEALVAETGRETAVALVGAHALTAEREAAVSALATLVADTASTLAAPVAFLKYAGMVHAGIRGRGWRGASDVDVLAVPGQAGALLDALVQAGLQRSGYPGYDHQLPLVSDPRGGVDVHVHVPELRQPGTPRFLELADALGGGWLRKVEGLPGEAYSPTRAMLLAHTIGHALGHHGMEPGRYPLLRMVGDVVDIGPSEDEARDAATLLEQDVSPREISAALSLARRLSEGDVDFAATDADEDLLLRHVLAGSLDAEYQRSLKIAPLRATPLAVARQAWRAVALTDTQLDAVYGRHHSRLAYTLRRIARPLDLARRTASAALASWRVRRRS